MPVSPQPSSSHTVKLGHKHVRWMWYDTLRRSVAYQTYKCEHHGFAVSLTAKTLSWRVGWVMTADRLHFFLNWQGKTTELFFFFSWFEDPNKKIRAVYLPGAGTDRIPPSGTQWEVDVQVPPWSFLCRNLSVSLHYSWEQNLYNTARRTTWMINASETICFTW